ncbi:MAG: sigma-70 family RNA polymerase sigma factor [Planctomycetales bacterium]|nr:sigma-70 family RNA polymerase sigma factor [Planctomycetales bacterium]
MEPLAQTGTARDPSAVEFLRAREGDGAAFAAFLARYEGRLARIVRAFVPPTDAEDVFQEVCLRLVAKGRLYDPSRPLVPWLDAVARQVAAAWLRRRGRRPADRSSGEDLDALPAPSGGAGDPWVLDAVREYVAGRPAREREALRLVLGNGLTQREAAAQLGVPSGTVAGWLARAVRMLRERLGGSP